VGLIVEKVTLSGFEASQKKKKKKSFLGGFSRLAKFLNEVITTNSTYYSLKLVQQRSKTLLGEIWSDFRRTADFSKIKNIRGSRKMVEPI
jgi:hypothetical protein